MFDEYYEDGYFDDEPSFDDFDDMGFEQDDLLDYDDDIYEGLFRHSPNRSTSLKATQAPLGAVASSGLGLSPVVSTVMVDTLLTLHNCLADVSSDPPPAALAVDIEGVNLGRDGRVAIVQLFVKGSRTVWLVDITTLGHRVFDEVDKRGKSLRGVLEGHDTTKYFWDVRNDSDALFASFSVRLQNVCDLQILELAVRRARRERTTYVNGLQKSMEQYGLATRAWTDVKNAGVKLFAPDKGGSYEVFEARPLRAELLLYCAQDVALLFKLEDSMRMQVRYASGMVASEAVIKRESMKRVALSHTPTYNGYGRHKALSTAVWN